MRNLAEEIEEMRQVLTNLVEQKNYNFMDAEVQALSCKLDKLIVDCQYAKKTLNLCKMRKRAIKDEFG